MRVSVDVDKSELRALMAFYGMRFRYAQTPTIHRTGMGGYHLIARGLPLDWREAFEERMLFHDDSNRVWLDRACSHKPMQTLFVTNEARQRYPIDEQALLAPPWWASRFVRKQSLSKYQTRLERASSLRGRARLLG
jgi:hypothetical protein